MQNQWHVGMGRCPQVAVVHCRCAHHLRGRRPAASERGPPSSLRESGCSPLFSMQIDLYESLQLMTSTVNSYLALTRFCSSDAPGGPSVSSIVCQRLPGARPRAVRCRWQAAAQERQLATYFIHRLRPRVVCTGCASVIGRVRDRTRTQRSRQSMQRIACGEDGRPLPTY